VHALLCYCLARLGLGLIDVDLALALASCTYDLVNIHGIASPQKDQYERWTLNR